MSKKIVPNAWDDDWEAQADRAAAEDTEPGGAALTEEPVVLSRAERLAKHEEEQRKLWKSADEPEEFHFLTANNNVPLGAGIKPAMKVLSRKPAPQVIKRRDPVTGLEQLTIRDDAAEAAAEAEAEAARNQLSPEQIRQRQQREREEKQRKYDEARAKIFGEPLPSKSTASAPETAASAASASPSRTSSRQASPLGSGTSSPGHAGRGRGRGRSGNHGGNHGNHGGSHRDYRRAQQQQAGGPATAGTRELFDPNYSTRPGGHPNTRRGGSDMASPGRSGTPREEDYVIRTPRGPDGSGRGGFGFTRRGG